MAKKTESVVAEIRPLDIKKVKIKIVGDSPLIVHCFDEKSKKEMLDNQTRSTKTKARDSRNPYDEFIKSLYWLTDMPESTPKAFEEAVNNGAKWGFKACSIKQAANSAAYRLGWVDNRMGLRGSYFLASEYGDFFEIKGSIPKIREDTVRIKTGATLRYRAEFSNWYAEMNLEYNASGIISLEQILNCINAGGYCCGLGEWRPEKDGNFGRFHIETI